MRNSKMAKDKIELSIVIVTYNSRAYLKACLDSILVDNQDVKLEIIVIDNNSKDDGAELIRRCYTQVNLTVNDKNRGFSKANNYGIFKCSAPYILLLNPDTAIPTGGLRELLDIMERHPEIGMLSPKLVRPDGSMDLACHRNFHTPLDIYFHILNIDKLFPNSKLFSHYNATYLDLDTSHEVECVAGAFMLVRREAIEEVGLFDERFFMYSEDTDWSYRFNLANWKVYYYAELEVLHHKKASARQDPVSMYKELYYSVYQCYEKYYGDNSPRYLNWIMRQTLMLKATLEIARYYLKTKHANA